MDRWAWTASSTEPDDRDGRTSRGDPWRHLLDFASQGDEVEPAGVVILHKVVCCYPDYEALVGAAAAHAKRQLLLTFPRESWWMRLGITAANVIERLRRRTFRVYGHPPAAMIAVARSHGLEPTSTHRGRLWEFCGLERTGPPC